MNRVRTSRRFRPALLLAVSLSVNAEVARQLRDTR
jgi:hypothetical protein